MQTAKAASKPNKPPAARPDAGSTQRPSATKRNTMAKIKGNRSKSGTVSAAKRAGGAPSERWTLIYRYLDGTPIAGSTEYRVVPEPTPPQNDGPRCRVYQIFSYREVNAAALLTFQAFGLRFHNAAVYAQVEAAAQRAGGRMLLSTLEQAGRSRAGRRLG